MSADSKHETARCVTLLQYVRWLFVSAKETHEMISSFGPFVAWGLAVAYHRAGFKLAAHDKEVAEAIEWIAGVWSVFNFLVLKPFQKHREDCDRIDELEARSKPRLSIAGIESAIHDSRTYPWNCRLKVTNRSLTTAENLRIEVVECKYENRSPNLKLPFVLDIEPPRFGTIHPGGEVIAKLGRADYGLEQSKIVDGEKVDVVTDPRIVLRLGDPPDTTYLDFKIDQSYPIQIRVMAKDFPATDEVFAIVFTPDGSSTWKYQLRPTCAGN